jgi:Pyruvate phosphate dikinase, AMP/ATP-binding domain/Lamin Tail Domain
MPRDCKTFRIGWRPIRNRSHTLGHGACGVLLALSGLGCGTGQPGASANPDSGVTPALSTDLGLNEVMAANGGVWIDQSGETDDWIELINRGSDPLRVSQFWIEDSAGARVRLRGADLAPGARRVFWADADEEQGDEHLPFKLSSGGDRLAITDERQRVVDEVEIPELGENQVLARFPDGSGGWSVCRYASPDADNGRACSPPSPPALLGNVEFQPFELEPGYPSAPRHLSFSELALRPAAAGTAYVELLNRGEASVLLDTVSARISTHAPERPWPGRSDGALLSLPVGVTLAPGERVAVDVPSAALIALETDPSFEGVVTLFNQASGEAIDRVDFMSWPRGNTLMQAPEESALFRFCTNATRGSANTCTPLLSRPVGDRLRHLSTPGDYAALAKGEEQLGIQSVKFVVDLQAPGLVHLLSSARWPLHYTFIRERIYQEPVLDRCDPAQNSEFYQGWSDFSALEYFRVEGRRFLLGTLERHASVGLKTVEYALGDVISGPQMREGYYSVLSHTEQPSDWVLRPQDDKQVQKARDIEGSLPLVPPNAPFVGITYQPLTEGVAYGTLRFVAAADLDRAALGPDIILITDDVPNDIPLVGGLITEGFQTPLAHVNVLSQNRGTPNASLKAARTELGASLDQLVRLEVSADGVHVTPTSADEARQFLDSRRPAGPLVAARLDTTLRGVQPLAGHNLTSLPAIGAKAAQLAELGTMQKPWCGNQERIETPASPFAIPLVHSLEHFAASGASALLDELQNDSDFIADGAARAAGLARVRQKILEYPVDPSLVAAVEAAVRSRFGEARVRFRSSSNTEDLPGFNGAGLYTSTSAQLGDPERSVPDAMRSVWASLYNARAYDERTYGRIDAASVAMGILVHEAFLGERANGVAVSRNVLDPTRGDIYYVNAQAGEASVTNPAPGVATEQLVYRWGREPPILYQGDSSLLGALVPAASKVLSADEVVDLTCALRSIHELYRPLLDADGQNHWFAMEVEFKFYGPDRKLLIKQARPQSFGRSATFSDCREL